MKRILLVVVLMAVLLAGCSRSVMGKVTISNVEEKSYRPEGYVLTGDLSKDGFAWGGEIISGNITNNSNETLTVAVVIHSYGAGGKNSRYHESNEVRLAPGETKKFSYNFVYDDQNVPRPFAWYHDISDVVRK